MTFREKYKKQDNITLYTDQKEFIDELLKKNPKIKQDFYRRGIDLAIEEYKRVYEQGEKK